MAGLIPQPIWNALDSLLVVLLRRAERARRRLDHRQPDLILDPTSRLFPEAVVTNDQKNPTAIRVGPYCSIRGELLVSWKTGSITLGEWCYVGASSRIWSQASITIGDRVLISHLVDIHDTDSHPAEAQARAVDVRAILTNGEYVLPTQTRYAPIVIEDDAWIGFKASILKGVRIGRGAIVAAGSVVTKDVPPYSVVAGNPAVVVKTLPPPE